MFTITHNVARWEMRPPVEAPNAEPARWVPKLVDTTRSQHVHGSLVEGVAA